MKWTISMILWENQEAFIDYKAAFDTKIRIMLSVVQTFPSKFEELFNLYSEQPQGVSA